jgi:ATP-dependent Clp protease adaptor protein ClpS
MVSTHAGTVALPDLKQGQATKTNGQKEPGWLVICWNDPVNLTTFVTHVFMKVFGWPRNKAEFHMLQVHREGKSVLKRETLERAEFYVHQLQAYGLHATMERAGE